MFSQMYDNAGKGAYALPEFLASTKYQNPEDYKPAAFQLGRRTDLGFWEYLKADPKREELFNRGMQARLALDKSVYPFEAELNREPLAPGETVLVDVGGGNGQTLRQILTEFPDMKGSMILQDQASVIEDTRKRGLLPERVQAQPISFFEPNPVKYARAYLFRRIFHDWADPSAIKILENVRTVMGPRSRILISDTIVPRTAVPWNIALQDINMMACFGGLERTEEQWQALLSKVGLKMHKVWSTAGSKHAVIEGRL